MGPTDVWSNMHQYYNKIFQWDANIGSESGMLYEKTKRSAVPT